MSVSETITYDKLRQILIEKKRYSYESGLYSLGKYSLQFWSQQNPAARLNCRKLEIFLRGPNVLGVRVKSGCVLEKEDDLGYYGGVLVPFECGWNSCGLDRKLYCKAPESLVQALTRNHTWYLPRDVYGDNFSAAKTTDYHVDAYVNGNWCQFINEGKGLQVNCVALRTGRIKVTKRIKEGEELLLDYHSSLEFEEIERATTYLSRRGVKAPSLSTLSKSIWIYPCKPTDGQIRVTKSPLQEYTVKNAEEHMNFPNVFVPFIRQTARKEPYITLECIGTNLRWRVDNLKANTFCDTRLSTTARISTTTSYKFFQPSSCKLVTLA